MTGERTKRYWVLFVLAFVGAWAAGSLLGDDAAPALGGNADDPAWGEAVEAARIAAMAAEADSILVGTFEDILHSDTDIGPIYIALLKDVRALKGSQFQASRVVMHIPGPDARLGLTEGGGELNLRAIIFRRDFYVAQRRPRPSAEWPANWLLPYSEEEEQRVRDSIPLPEEWGKEADGLRMGLRLRKPACAAGEEIPVEICIQNVSDDPITLWQHRFNIYDYYEHTRFNVTAPDGKRWKLTKLATAIDEYDRPLHRTLQPGENYVHTVRLNTWPGDPTNAKEAGLPQGGLFAQPGEYTVTCTYSVQVPAQSNLWTGTLRSNTVTVNVVRPSDVDGPGVEGEPSDRQAGSGAE